MTWFKAKRHGWGWYPATWQAWFIFVLFVILTVIDLVVVINRSDSTLDTLAVFIPHLLSLILIFSGICYITGETPHWHWNSKKRRSQRR